VKKQETPAFFISLKSKLDFEFSRTVTKRDYSLVREKGWKHRFSFVSAMIY